MLFNTTEFLLFLAAFLLLYSLVRARLQLRNLLIVAASYGFYAAWDWRFLALLILSSVVDFFVGLRLAGTSSPAGRRAWLGLSLVFNLGLLATFKYLGFFVESFHALLDFAGIRHASWSWHVVLPVGISFYTFQSLGYILDVYRRRTEPSRDLVGFLAFVAFFPQLVAGPIERAAHLIPQFLQTRVLRLADVEHGAWLILAGLFKKVVVADQLAPFANLAFQGDVVSAPVLLLGTVAFAGQIYGDFSGYSDIARGVSLLLGFELMRNFDRPYAATSIRDFWRRWHISLSTWMRDYVYVPLGGSRGTATRTTLHLLLTFVVAGLWHGAAWNFVLWGAWHGAAVALHHQWSRRPWFTLPRPLAWLLTLSTVGGGWLLFRAASPGSLAHVRASLLTWSAPPWVGEFALGMVPWLLPLGLLEFWPAPGLSPNSVARWSPPRRAAFAGLLVLAIAAYWEREASPFVYFQF
ncbi:MAG: MBOAT family protein [Limisphaerales bacterium]